MQVNKERFSMVYPAFAKHRHPPSPHPSSLGFWKFAKNRDVRLMLELLVDVWSESLVADERMELEKFIVLETRTIDRGERRGTLISGEAPRSSGR
jgi:hypothetical protein